MRKSHSVPHPKTYKVIIILDYQVKAHRDRVSGAIRRLTQEPDILIDNLPLTLRSAKKPPADGILFGRTRPPAFKRLPVSMITVNINYGIDNNAIVQAAADLLLRRGYTNFGFIGSNICFESRLSTLRTKLFRQYIRAKGYACKTFSFPKDRRLPLLEETKALAKFIKGLEKPCGIMLYADNMAQTVLNACRYAGVSVPEQVSLVGVDNETEICEMLRPTLSSVFPDFESEGYLAADILVRKLHGEPLPEKRTPCGVKAVIERDSTRDLRCGGHLVARIETYLKENYTQKVTIGDLASRFHASRRLIEMRFRAIKGCSVLQRLTALRIADAKHKLQTTTIPICEIAAACGYGSDRAFRHTFEATVGISPHAFRKSAASWGQSTHPRR